MIKKAEQFEEEDRIIKERVDAKHALQSYIYNMRNTVEDKDKLADKLSSDDKNTILEAIATAEEWLQDNENDDSLTGEDFQDTMKEMQAVCDPFIASVYNSQGYQGDNGADDEEFEDL